MVIGSPLPLQALPSVTNVISVPCCYTVVISVLHFDTDCTLLLPDNRQQTGNSRRQTAEGRQQTADSRQQTADSRGKQASPILLQQYRQQ
jgi:hypothetical protein